ncbi:PilN domain-containing protein [Candidatus Hydrogenedentota bacterium]
MNRQIDMIPEEHFESRLIRQRFMKWLALSITVSAAVLPLGLLTRMNAAKLERSVTPLRESVVSMQGWAGKVAPLADKLQTALGQQSAVKGLLNEPNWCGLFSDVSRAVDKELWLTDLNVRKETRSKEDSGDENREVMLINMSGIAPSNFEVLEFMRRLSESNHLGRLDLKISKMPRFSEDNPSVEFEVRGELR